MGKRLLALKKIQQENVASMKGNVSVAINVAKTLSSLDASLKEKISMAKKTMEFAKEKGQHVGTADDKIVSDLESREENTTRALKAAVATKDIMARKYLKQQDTLNNTLKELRKFETGATGSNRQSATGDATGSSTGATGSSTGSATGAATGSATGATGSISGATGTETGATGAETGPEDNIAAT